MDINLGITIFRGKNINTAAKDTGKGKVDTLACADGDRRRLTVTMGNTVSQKNKIHQCIRQIARCKTSSKEHNANGVSNGMVGTFSTAIGTGSRRRSHFYLKPSFLK